MFDLFNVLFGRDGFLLSKTKFESQAELASVFCNIDKKIIILSQPPFSSFFSAVTFQLTSVNKDQVNIHAT